MKQTYITSNGAIRVMPQYGTADWRMYQYEQVKIANKGHNYQYWNDEKHQKMLDNGYDLYKFDEKYGYAISSELHAKEIVDRLRSEGNYVRIICGYEKTVQRIKHYSILFKKKK